MKIFSKLFRKSKSTKELQDEIIRLNKENYRLDLQASRLYGDLSRALDDLSMSNERIKMIKRDKELMVGKMYHLEAEVRTLKDDLNIAKSNNKRIKKCNGRLLGRVLALNMENQNLANDLAHFKSQVEPLEYRVKVTEKTAKDCLSSEHAISDAYVKLRTILGADVLPKGVPSSFDNIKAFTEVKAEELVKRADSDKEFVPAFEYVKNRSSVGSGRFLSSLAQIDFSEREVLYVRRK